PMHTIIPAIAESKKGVLAFGVMGGHYQAAGQAWFLHKWLDEGLDLQSALDSPRLFSYPDKLYAEKGVDAKTCAQLRKHGHIVAQAAQPIGAGQAVLRMANGVVIAASDSRKDGIAAGY
ncbi:MAG: gamma-glutamyltransferase, partial [Gammaproteobacteria bacterium]